MKSNTAQKAAPAAPAMQQIEAATGLYAVAHAGLVATVAGLNDELEAVKKKYLPRIRKEAAHAKGLKEQLKTLIEGKPELFERPRTAIFHGVRVGFRKGEGKVAFEYEADKVIALIEKHLADQAELLIITERKPNKEAIAQLPAADVKRIGCSIEGTGDLVVIKDAASEVDKLVAALLKDEPEESA